MVQGEKNKLKAEEIMTILERQGSISPYDLAKEYNVSHTTIYNIWKSKKYHELYRCKKQSILLRKLLTEVFNLIDNADLLSIPEWTDQERKELMLIIIEEKLNNIKEKFEV